MKALNELGLKKGGQIVTVDDVIQTLNTETQNSHNVSDLESSTFQTIISIDPIKICNWELSDRPENELGDLEALAKDLKENGQQQPCIVRPYKKNKEFDYELIAGERRWRAAKLFNLNLKVINVEMSDDQAAICQIAENNNRNDLSDFAKGMNYSKLIELDIITQKELEKTLGKNNAAISRLLSFNQVPQEIWDAIDDKTKVSARTASEIRALSRKGENYISAIIQLAPRIRSGKLGSTTLANEVDKIINKSSNNINDIVEVRSSSGRHLFTWRKDSNGNMAISFPKDIRNYIDRSFIEKSLKDEIENQIKKIDAARQKEF
jgi:ParB family chromosome partitioning protein